MKTEIYIYDNDNNDLGFLAVPSQGQAIDMAQQLTKVKEVGHCRVVNFQGSITHFHIIINGSSVFNATLPANS